MWLPMNPFVHRAALLAKIDEGDEALDEFLDEVKQDSKTEQELAAVVDCVLSDGGTAYQECVRNDMWKQRCVLAKYGAKDTEETLVHEILAVRKPGLLDTLGDTLETLVNKKERGRTPLDVLLSRSWYPHIDSLIAADEEENETEEIENEDKKQEEGNETSDVLEEEEAEKEDVVKSSL